MNRGSAQRAAAEGCDTLVLGSAVGLTLGQVLPFLASLRNCGYQGDVALIVSRGQRRRLRGHRLGRRSCSSPDDPFCPSAFGRCERVVCFGLSGGSYRCSVGPSPREWADSVDNPSRRRLQATIAELACTPVDARFLHYQRFLEAHHYRRVLLTDVRDVLFQSDPFSQFPRSGLAVGIEARRHTIASEPTNRSWVRLAYGQRILDQIGGNPVSCAGVTYGDADSISMYLDLMVGEIVTFQHGPPGEVDQTEAVHNFLLWTGRLGPVQHLQTLETPLPRSMRRRGGGEADFATKASEPRWVRAERRAPVRPIPSDGCDSAPVARLLAR